MSSIWLLLGLLLLSYAGSLLVGKRTVGGGLPAGTEYVLLGFVLGPSALGLVEKSLLVAFEPVSQAALGWLAFVLGLQYALKEGRRVSLARMAGSWIAFLITAACIGGTVYGALRALACAPPPGASSGLFATLCAPGLSETDRRVIAAGTAASTAETTRYAVRSVVHRYRANGPVTDLVGDFAESDDLAPLLAVAAVFALSRGPELGAAFGGALVWFALTLALGALLGAMSAVLLGQTFQVGEAWSVLLGMTMLSIGTASRLGLAGITAMFTLGAAVSVVSRHRAEVLALIAPTERPVMLPALLLAGATVDFTRARWFAWLLPVALLARFAAKLLVGFGLYAGGPARSAGPLVGLGLTSAGALAMSLGLTFALRFPGVVGAAVLASAAVATAAGELVGPRGLTSALRRAGEAEDEAPPSSQLAPKPVADVASEDADEAEGG